MATHLQHSVETEDDPNIVDMWLKIEPKRWAAGIMAGLFAGVVMLAFAAIVAVAGGMEATFPIKVAAIPILGGAATEYGNMTALVLGFAVHELLCAVLGIAYAHFTSTNSMPTLLGAGFVWGTFSWIFISNLFVQSFPEISALALPRGPLFPINLVFGLSLASVAFFDRILRGNR